jgi:hypothetical protein
VNQDETPTPKQSGSFGIMQGICEDTLRSLAAWRVRGAGTERADIVDGFIARFRRNHAAVLAWGEEPPSPDAKAATVRDILDAREEARDWGARWGWTL